MRRICFHLCFSLPLFLKDARKVFANQIYLNNLVVQLIASKWTNWLFTPKFLDFIIFFLAVLFICFSWILLASQFKKIFFWFMFKFFLALLLLSYFCFGFLRGMNYGYLKLIHHSYIFFLEKWKNVWFTVNFFIFWLVI